MKCCYLEVVDLFEISVDGGVGGVHDEERECQVQHDEGHRVGDVTSEYHTGGNNGVRHHCYRWVQSHHISPTACAGSSMPFSLESCVRVVLEINSDGWILQLILVVQSLLQSRTFRMKIHHQSKYVNLSMNQRFLPYLQQFLWFTLYICMCVQWYTPVIHKLLNTFWQSWFTLIHAHKTP